MSNHIDKILKVTGYSSYVAQFINATYNVMCFMEMPEEHIAVEESKEDGNQYITQEEANSSIVEYGVVNLYDWCNKFWRTKCGAYDIFPELDIVKT